MLYCPKCATQNMDNARFCRACGSDISLVPAALTGQMPQAPVVEEEDDSRRGRRRRRKRKEPTYEKAFENMGVGLAFLVISIAVALFMPSGRFWWFWLLIPGLGCIGEGVGQFMRLRQGLPPASSAISQAELSSSSSRPADGLPPRSISEIMSPPPSVTEGTTRHLGAEAPNRHTATPE